MTARFLHETHVAPDVIVFNRNLSDHHIPFNELTPIHPCRRFVLETDPQHIAMRVIDLLAPVGQGRFLCEAGQESVVVSPRTTVGGFTHLPTRNSPERALSCHSGSCPTMLG